MKHLSILVVTGLLSLLALYGCSERSESKKEITAADSLEIKLKGINTQIKADPNNPDLYIERCKLLASFGAYQRSFYDAARAVKLDSTKASYWLEYGKAAFSAENYYRSEEGYLTCLRLDKKNTDCLIKLAEFYLLKKKYQMAIDCSNKALEVNQELPRPYFIKGWVYKEAKDTVKAVTSFQTAVEMDPNFYDAFIQLGVLTSGAKKDVALDYFNSAIAAQPKSIEAHYFKGMYFQERGRVEEALATYMQILAIDSTYPFAHYNIGFIKLTAENKPDSAILYFAKAIKANPRYFEAYYNRGYCYELLGNKSLASNDYKLALSINSQFDLAAAGLDRVQ